MEDVDQRRNDPPRRPGAESTEDGGEKLFVLFGTDPVPAVVPVRPVLAVADSIDQRAEALLVQGETGLVTDGLAQRRNELAAAEDDCTHVTTVSRSRSGRRDSFRQRRFLPIADGKGTYARAGWTVRKCDARLRRALCAASRDGRQLGWVIDANDRRCFARS